MNLWLIILVPFLTAAAILILPSRLSRQIALGSSLLQFFLAMFLLYAFMHERSLGNVFPYLFESISNWFPQIGFNVHFGVDGIGLGMIFLTSLVVLAGVLISWKQEKMTKEFFLMLILLSAGAYGFFISLDLMLMFFFLEVAVVPKYLLISIWGSGNKNYSANKLALMLMGGSALILVGILGLFFSLTADQRSFDLIRLNEIQIPNAIQYWVFPLIFTGFGVFTAMFPFHTWVPDGHSSAPTAGSMFLAGISMKLGGFGAIKAATFLLPEAAVEYSNVIIILSTIAIIYGAFATMMQKDLKYMNAYSSISHCGFVILGIGMLTKASLSGAILQMISHGLMTALFFAIIGMLYERTHTRQIADMSGLLKGMPFIISVMMITGLCSLGLPGFSGFVAEMSIFSGSWERNDMFHRTATIIATMSIVVTAVYILRAVGQIGMGPVKEEHKDLPDAQWNERFAAIILIIGILSIGLAPFWINDLVMPGAEIITNKIAGK